MTIDDAIGATAGIIPLVLVAGVATKMTDNMFGTTTTKRRKKSSKKKSGNYLKQAHKALGIG